MRVTLLWLVLVINVESSRARGPPSTPARSNLSPVTSQACRWAGRRISPSREGGRGGGNPLQTAQIYELTSGRNNRTNVDLFHITAVVSSGQKLISTHLKAGFFSSFHLQTLHIWVFQDSREPKMVELPQQSTLNHVKWRFMGPLLDVF